MLRIFEFAGSGFCWLPAQLRMDTSLRSKLADHLLLWVSKLDYQRARG